MPSGSCTSSRTRPKTAARRGKRPPSRRSSSATRCAATTLSGRAYLIGIGTDDENWKDLIWWMEILRSEDGGRTWGKGARMPGGDRPYLAFDFSNGPTRGVGYVVYSVRATLLDKIGPAPTLRDAAAPTLEVRRTNDGGRTWSKAAVGVGSNLAAFPTATGAAVLSDGTFVTLWLERAIPKMDPAAGEPAEEGGKALHAVTAAPGADIFRRSVKVADLVDDYAYSGTFYSLAADATPGPTRDRLYAAWTDRGAGPRSQIRVSRSADRGATWSAPVTVNTDGPASASEARDDYLPTVAVNRDGVVGVSWRRRGRSEEQAEVWFAASRDGGVNWLPPGRVSAPGGPVAGGLVKATLRTTDDGLSPTSRVDKHFKGGDTSGLAADANGTFHAFWSDQRSGIGQTYAATVRVDGAEAVRRATMTSAEIRRLSARSLRRNRGRRADPRRRRGPDRRRPQHPRLAGRRRRPLRDDDRGQPEGPEEPARRLDRHGDARRRRDEQGVRVHRRRSDLAGHRLRRGREGRRGSAGRLRRQRDRVLHGHQPRQRDLPLPFGGRRKDVGRADGPRQGRPRDADHGLHQRAVRRPRLRDARDERQGLDGDRRPRHAPPRRPVSVVRRRALVHRAGPRRPRRGEGPRGLQPAGAVRRNTLRRDDGVSELRQGERRQDVEGPLLALDRRRRHLLAEAHDRRGLLRRPRGDAGASEERPRRRDHRPRLRIGRRREVSGPHLRGVVRARGIAAAPLPDALERSGRDLEPADARGPRRAGRRVRVPAR